LGREEPSLWVLLKGTAKRINFGQPKRDKKKHPHGECAKVMHGNWPTALRGINGIRQKRAPAPGKKKKPLDSKGKGRGREDRRK